MYDIVFKDASEINILYDQYTSKGNNLYTVMDRGVVGLITDKSLLRDGVGDALGIVLSDSGFIQAELWLDTFVGTPDSRWRGRAEGSIKSSQNVQVPGLVFIGDQDVYLLSGNGVIALGSNYAATLVDAVKAITGSTVLTATIDAARNELWLKIGSSIHVYSFTVNNWVATIHDSQIVDLTFAKLFDSSRMTRVSIVKYFESGQSWAFITKSDDTFEFDSDTKVPVALPQYIDFAVTPEVGSQVEFTDIFINSNVMPNTIVCSKTYDFVTDPFTAVGSAGEIKDIGNLYRLTLGRTDNNTEELICNTLYVRIYYSVRTEVKLGYVKTGYKKVVGS